MKPSLNPTVTDYRRYVSSVYKWVTVEYDRFFGLYSLEHGIGIESEDLQVIHTAIDTMEG